MRDPRRTAEWRRARTLALNTKDWVCYICGQEIPYNAPRNSPWKLEVDHIIPIHLGGDPFNQANLGMTHLFCNRSKGEKLPSAIDTREKVGLKKGSEGEIESDYMSWLGE